MVAAAAPLSARSNAVLRTAGTAQVTAATYTPRPKNPLLTKDSVGRAKPSCYDLPEEYFAYGRPGNHDSEGAREVSMHWVSHTPSQVPEVNSLDFVAINRKAVGVGIATAKDLKHFRKDQEMSSAPPGSNTPLRTPRDVIPSDVIPGFAYGRRVRPSTPIQEVITGRFAEQSERALTRFYAEQRELQQAEGCQVRRIPLTAASRGHASVAKKTATMQSDYKELFKISKFKRVPAKVVNRELRTPRSFFDDGAESETYSESAPGLLVEEPEADHLSQRCSGSQRSASHSGRGSMKSA